MTGANGTLAEWEVRFREFLVERIDAADPAHDLAHVRRVVSVARGLAEAEGASLEVVVPAAWLHDCVVVAKDDPARAEASARAAALAGDYLRRVGYPTEHVPAVEHAIVAHSFSAGVPPQTLEARVVQDADRLDALGAVGIARCFTVGGTLGRPLYHPDEIFPEAREADDGTYTVDHFFVKLLRLPETMHTASAREEARRRAAFMESFLVQLGCEAGT